MFPMFLRWLELPQQLIEAQVQMPDNQKVFCSLWLNLRSLHCSSEVVRCFDTLSYLKSGFILGKMSYLLGFIFFHDCIFCKNMQAFIKHKHECCAKK